MTVLLASEPSGIEYVAGFAACSVIFFAAMYSRSIWRAVICELRR